MKVATDEEAGPAGDEKETLLVSTQAGGGSMSLESEERRTAAAHEAQVADNKAKKAFYRLASFSALVFIGTLTQLSFKLSQRGGRYEYNTASAMCIVELVKLCIASLQHYRESVAEGAQASSAAGHPSGSRSSPSDIFRRTLRGLPLRLYAEYLLLAVSYAVYNQLIFAVMHLSDPGTFSLLKSFTPVLVGLINWQVTGLLTSELQWYCVFMQVFGIIPVIMKCGGELVTSPESLAFIMCVNCMGSLNSVYNAKLIKDPTWDASVSVQNMVLYAYGMTLAFIGYFALGGSGSSFFVGYGHKGVWALLVLNAFAGVAVSFVYRHGDAVLKTFAQPMSAAIVVYASSLLMKSPLDIVQAAGAGTVVLASLVYLRLPASKEASASTLSSSKKDETQAKIKALFVATPVNRAMVVCIVSGLAFIVSHLYIFNPEHSADSGISASSNADNSTATT